MDNKKDTRSLKTKSDDEIVIPFPIDLDSEIEIPLPGNINVEALLPLPFPIDLDSEIEIPLPGNINVEALLPFPDPVDLDSENETPLPGSINTEALLILPGNLNTETLLSTFKSMDNLSVETNTVKPEEHKPLNVDSLVEAFNSTNKDGLFSDNSLKKEELLTQKPRIFSTSNQKTSTWYFKNDYDTPYMPKKVSIPLYDEDEDSFDEDEDSFDEDECEVSYDKSTRLFTDSVIDKVVGTKYYGFDELANMSYFNPKSIRMPISCDIGFYETPYEKKSLNTNEMVKEYEKITKTNMTSPFVNELLMTNDVVKRIVDKNPKILDNIVKVTSDGIKNSEFGYVSELNIDFKGIFTIFDKLELKDPLFLDKNVYLFKMERSKNKVFKLASVDKLKPKKNVIKLESKHVFKRHDTTYDKIFVVVEYEDEDFTVYDYVTKSNTLSSKYIKKKFQNDKMWEDGKPPVLSVYLDRVLSEGNIINYNIADALMPKNNLRAKEIIFEKYIDSSIDHDVSFMMLFGEEVYKKYLNRFLENYIENRRSVDPMIIKYLWAPYEDDDEDEEEYDEYPTPYLEIMMIFIMIMNIIVMLVK